MSIGVRHLTAAAAVAAALVAPAQAGLIMTVELSSAPNAFGSPSWNSYVNNALFALENGLTTQGGSRATTPTAYEQLGSTFVAGDVMVTSYNSWRGDASPTGAFASEYGNRIHGGLHIVGTGGTRFRLEDLTFDMSSGDAGNALAYTGDFIGFNYSATRYGISYGGDGVKGGGDDTVYTSGNGLTYVDELVYVGVGNAFWPANPTDGTVDWINANVPWIAVQYCIKTEAGDEVCDADRAGLAAEVPEPAGLALLGAAAIAGMLTTRRRKTPAVHR